MNTTQKSQRTFMTVTMITVIAVTTVFIVYAAILGTYPGGNVSIQTMQGEIYYQGEGSTTWATTLSIGNGSAWYARLNITTNVPSQTVNVTWTLEWDNSGTWTTVGGTSAPETQIALTGVATAIYATANGGSSGNYNWGTHTTTLDRTYRVKAVVETP
jgi:hypothetical protein